MHQHHVVGVLPQRVQGGMVRRALHGLHLPGMITHTIHDSACHVRAAPSSCPHAHLLLKVLGVLRVRQAGGGPLLHVLLQQPQVSQGLSSREALSVTHLIAY